jgi:threonine dehydrogenase-like Zn-dependent dehydrogenase
MYGVPSERLAATGASRRVHLLATPWREGCVADDPIRIWPNLNTCCLALGEVLDLEETDDLAEAVQEMTDGRGPISVIDAVGMEAHGAPVAKFAHALAGLLPDAIGQQVMQNASTDRLTALHCAIELVQRGGTISMSGVYGGAASPMPLLQMFDKQINVRMGQANVKRWTQDILPLLTGDEDPLGVDEFATHHLPLEDAPHAYEIFQKKEEGAFKILLKP